MRIACVGQLVADVIVKGVTHLPDRGDVCVIDSVNLKTGGCALNCAVVLDRLGADVGLFGLVGDDPQGRFLLDEIAWTGIKAAGVKVRGDTPTTTSIIVVSEDGERTILYAKGSMERFSLSDLNLEELAGWDLWHIPGVSKLDSFDLRALLIQGREMGRILTIDTDFDTSGRWYENVAPYLEHLDYFLPSEGEARAISGREDPRGMAEFFLSKGVRNVVIKLGAKGAFYRTKDGEGHAPGFSVPCRDATGAGDSFVAGLLFGLSEGWDIEPCVRFGNACGALSVTEVGAGGAVRDLTGVLEFMRAQST